MKNISSGVPLKRETKYMILIFLTIISIVFVCLLPPTPQNPAYHNFADTRLLLNIPNCLNVLTNLPFIFIGIIGLFLLKNRKTNSKLLYAVMFTAIILTGIGSMYYHLLPNNERLVFDRIPMTLVFMSLLSIIVCEFINRTLGYVMLWPMLISGVLSVLWWYRGELSGVGDLRFYGWVQFYPMLFIAAVLLLFREQSPAVFRSLMPVVVWYIIAKCLESADYGIYGFTGGISGHSLKHLAAAASTWYLVLMYDSAPSRDMQKNR